MGLDVTTIVAQIINFAVLVWLLNRFLYRPITNVMKARAERLRRDMARARALTEEARQAETEYRERIAQLERERGRLLEEAREAARRERDRLLNEAAQEAQAVRRRFGESWAAERREIQAAVEASLVRHVTETTARIVAQLTGLPVADAIISTLETHWEEALVTAPEGLPAVDAGPVVVRTSFQPTEAQRERLAALARRLHRGTVGFGEQSGQGEEDGQTASVLPAVEFVVDPGLVLGIEIEGGGTAIAWTARDMLDDLRRDAMAALDAAVHRGGGQEPVTVDTPADVDELSTTGTEAASEATAGDTGTEADDDGEVKTGA